MAMDKEQLTSMCTGYADSAFWYQQRRHPEWDANYTLYRDRVQINRVTQRQSVNIPLMKYIVQTSLKEVDDPIDLVFKNRNNDKQKEVFLNQYFNEVKRDQKIDVRSVVDKKQVMLTGRSTSEWNIENGKVVFGIDDTYDIFFDQYTDPTDIDGTCHYMDHRHIFVPLSSLEGNPDYDQKVVKELKEFYSTDAGVVLASENLDSLTERNKRAQEMGQPQVANPEVGETFVELWKVWIKTWDEELEEECIYFLVQCLGQTLYCGRQEDVIGKTVDNYWRTHFLKTSWATDVEVNDMYSDGLCDMIRPAQLVVNAEFSQDVENRTLRNFGMNYFNSSLENFIPQVFEPLPWGWYPIPVPANQRISDVVSHVEIPALSDTTASITWIMGIMEKASAASSTSAGQINQQKVTLGEIELVLQESKERLKSMSVYYSPAWVERGEKFVKLCEAAGDRIDAVRIFKKGYKGNYFNQEVHPDDWYEKLGYDVEVTNKSDLRTRSLESLQTLQAVKQAMPNNQPLLEVYERKILDLVPDLDPEEIQRITEFQKQERTKMAQMSLTGGMPGSAGAMGAPGMNPGGGQQLSLPAPQQPMAA